MGERHAAIGAWRVAVQIPGLSEPLLNLAHLAADGGITAAFPSPTPAPPNASHRLEYWTTAIGAWQTTDETHVKMRFVSLGVDENAKPLGAHTVSATVTVDASGESWQGPFQISVTDATGKAAGEVSGTVFATRITAG